MRRRDPQGHRLNQVAARDVAAHHRHELVFAQMVLGEHRVEQGAIEAAVGRPEARVVGDGAADHVVRNVEPQPGRLLIEQTAVDQLFEDLVDDPELFGLLEIDRAAKPRAQPLERRPQGRLQFLGMDALVADGGDHGIGRAVAENVADTPDPEGQDQETEEKFDDEGSRPGADRLEHGGKWPLFDGRAG